MFVIKHPPKIIFGKNSVKEFSFPEDCLVITSQGAKSRNWLSDLDVDNFEPIVSQNFVCDFFNLK